MTKLNAGGSRQTVNYNPQLSLALTGKSKVPHVATSWQVDVGATRRQCDQSQLTQSIADPRSGIGAKITLALASTQAGKTRYQTVVSSMRLVSGYVVPSYDQNDILLFSILEVLGLVRGEQRGSLAR